MSNQQPRSGKNPLQRVVDDAIQKAKKPGATTPADAGPADPFADRRAGRYGIETGVMCAYKPTYDREARERIELSIPLTVNFSALLAEEILIDDGLEVRAAFVIVGRAANNQPLPRVTVPASEFGGMAWITRHWGNRAIVAAGQSVKDNLRAALQILSGDIPRRTVYTHTGWRPIDGDWLYLSGSGAIGKDGLREDITVDLGPGNMSRYRLPAPTTGSALQVAAGALFGLLDLSPGNPALGAALFAAAVRAPLPHPPDFAIFFAGITGCYKSESASLLQACFGDFSARNFPGNWSDTEADLEHKAHQAKDAVFVVDEFTPSVNSIEASKLHGKGERIFRAVGNQAGRGRRNHDLSARPAYHPRGLLVATGEDTPRSASLLGRILVIEMRSGEVDLGGLSALQHVARSGLLRESMAGYVQYLAGRMDDIQRTLPDIIRRLRDQALADGHARSHPRVAEIFASLQAGIETYLDFSVDVRAISATEAGDYQRRIEAALLSAFAGQADYQTEQDETARFVALLRACLISGNAHIADRLTQGAPQIRPHSWGWRTESGDNGDRTRPMGDLIGWIKPEDDLLWLEPDATFKAVQAMAKAQNHPLLIAQATLWRRLMEKGLLAQVEKRGQGRRDCSTVPRGVGGRNVRVLVLLTKTLEGADEKS